MKVEYSTVFCVTLPRVWLNCSKTDISTMLINIQMIRFLNRLFKIASAVPTRNVGKNHAALYAASPVRAKHDGDTKTLCAIYGPVHPAIRA